MNTVWKTSKATGSHLTALLALADWARKENGECWPSINMLAERVRLSERQTQRLLQHLIQIGELEVIKQGGHGKGDRPRYRIPAYLKGDIHDTLRKPSRVTSMTAKGDIHDTHLYISTVTIDPLLKERGTNHTNHNHHETMKFTPPTIEELKLYAGKIGLPESEAEAFMDHHQARGWKFKGGQTMKDPQAALRTWKRIWQEKRSPQRNGVSDAPPVFAQIQSAEILLKGAQGRLDRCLMHRPNPDLYPQEFANWKRQEAVLMVERQKLRNKLDDLHRQRLAQGELL